MEVFIQRKGVTKRLRFHGSGKALLAKLAINPVTVVIVRNGEVITEADTINDDDAIKLLSVISGG